MSNPAALEPINAERRARTHCPQQHPYTEENTIRAKDGSRHCRACQRICNHNSYIKRHRRHDGIVDEIAVERALRGDVSVYNNLTRQEHRTLVLLLVESEELPPIKNLRSAVQQARQRRASRAVVH